MINEELDFANNKVLEVFSRITRYRASGPTKVTVFTLKVTFCTRGWKMQTFRV